MIEIDEVLFDDGHKWVEFSSSDSEAFSLSLACFSFWNLARLWHYFRNCYGYFIWCCFFDVFAPWESLQPTFSESGTFYFQYLTDQNLRHFKSIRILSIQSTLSVFFLFYQFTVRLKLYFDHFYHLYIRHSPFDLQMSLISRYTYFKSWFTHLYIPER